MIIDQKSFEIEGSFGGKQNWLLEHGITSKFWADRSCGVVAAANLIKFISENHLDKRNLYQGQTKDDYIQLMSELYKILSPRIWGIPSLTKMEKGIMKYSKERGISLVSSKNTWLFDMEEGSKFIRQGLALNSPVLLLTWNHSDKNFKNHWITITGWDIVYGEEYMTVSNWGQKRVYSYKEWAIERSLFKGAIYFQ